MMPFLPFASSQQTAQPGYAQSYMNQPSMTQPMSSQPVFNLAAMNPMQKLQFAYQAMSNPPAFVKQFFPDIPDSIQFNPNQILQYLQQSRQIPNSQIQNLVNQYPR